ncbi:MAG: GerMN domain-containing protein [Spirochaetaceae bacterium]
MARKQKKQHASFGVLFWIAFILLITTIFLYNRDQISRVLAETELVEVLKDRVGIGASDGEAPRTEEEEDDGMPTPEPDAGEGDGSEDIPRVVQIREPDGGIPERGPDEPEETPSEDTRSEDERVDETPEAEEAPSSGAPPSRPDSDAEREVTRVRDAGVYFIRVTDDGKIHPHRVERRISYVDSPMTEAIKTLISGPTVEELNQGLLNLIPKGTELLSARVQNGTAYLNFNESFRFNSMGVEGFLAQLQQVVFSSTEFDTVERVQFLIDGSRREYLGGEGVYIGEPLTRDSFG